MDATTTGLLIGGLLTVLGTLINRLVDMIQHSIEWKRDKEKLTLEHNAAKEKQIREQLQDIYANAIRNLSEVVIDVHRSSSYGSATVTKIGEAQRWLALFIIYYHDKESEAFKRFYTEFVQISPHDQGLEGNLSHLRNLIIEFANNDPRLK